MAGHGRTSWDDVAVVTVSILRLVARYEKQNGEPASLSRRELAKVVGVSEYRVHAAIGRLVKSGLVSSEARYRDDGAPHCLRPFCYASGEGVFGWHRIEHAQFKLARGGSVRKIRCPISSCPS